MKTVDLLVAAKERINTPAKWTSGRLFGKRRSGAGAASIPYSAAARNLSEADCFCAIGALAMEVSTTSVRPLNEITGTGFSDSGSSCPVHIPQANRKAFVRAAEYLNQAADQLEETSDTALKACPGGRTMAFRLNDLVASKFGAEGHKEVMAMYDIAIRNAKRRHKNGKRYAKEAV